VSDIGIVRQVVTPLVINNGSGSRCRHVVACFRQYHPSSEREEHTNVTGMKGSLIGRFECELGRVLEFGETLNMCLPRRVCVGCLVEQQRADRTTKISSQLSKRLQSNWQSRGVGVLFISSALLDMGDVNFHSRKHRIRLGTSTGILNLPLCSLREA